MAQQELSSYKYHASAFSNILIDLYKYIYIYIYIFVKKIGINNNYVANDVVMRWRNRSSAAINATLQLLVIY